MMTEMESLAALLGLLCLQATALAQTPLRVAAAADLEPVLPPILEQFQQGYRHPGGSDLPGLGHADHADPEWRSVRPVSLRRHGLSEAPDRCRPGRRGGIFGTVCAHHLRERHAGALWTRKDSHLPPPSLDLLRNPALKRLAIANPDRAPYGRAAVAALTSLKLYDELKPRIVTAENIAQAAQFVDSGNADAGLISLTSALTARLASSGSYFVIPRNLYPPIEQGAVILSRSTQRAAAQQVARFPALRAGAGTACQERPHPGSLSMMDWQAFALTLRLAAVTTAILLAVAVPLAALLVLGRGRWLAGLEALPRFLWCCRPRCWDSFCWCCWDLAPLSVAE